MAIDPPYSQDNFPSVHFLALLPSSTAALPQSSPWLCISPSIIPALAIACFSFSTVSSPKMTGIPVSRPTLISPFETASAMYSKCIVSPFISTPIAITASKEEVRPERLE